MTLAVKVALNLYTANQIFLAFEAFECNTTSDWLLPTVVLHSNIQNLREKDKECSREWLVNMDLGLFWERVRDNYCGFLMSIFFLTDNWAFLYAQKLALKMEVPLHVCFCLVPKFLDATIRHYTFLLEGLKEVEKVGT